MKTLKMLFAVVIVTFFIAGSPSKTFAQDKPTEKTVQMEVSMHCNSCKNKIERDLAFEKGVKEVKADLEQKIVTIKYLDGKTDEEKLVKALKKLGYEATVIKETKKDEAKK